jgi:tetratricopeptide (TPR) repeat protein
MRRDATRSAWGWLGCLLCLLCLPTTAACAAEANQPEGGAEALRRGDYEKAVELFTDRIDEEPADVEARKSLVQAYRDTGRYRDAIWPIAWERFSRPPDS